MNKNVVMALSLGLIVSLSSCKEQSGENANVAPYVKAQNATKQAIENQKMVRSEEKRIPPADGKYPKLTFTEVEHDFGNIASGDKVEHVFHFKNTGEADLIIDKAVGSCGCTVPEYPKEPLKPGQSGQMKVSFNSAGKHGQQAKTVTVHSNTESGVEKLTVKASISDANKAS